MFDPHDLAVRIRAGTPLLLIETNEEALLLDAFRHVVAELLRPLWRWSITGGLARLDIDDPFVPAANESSAVLDTMRRDTRRGIWLLLDFAPYLRYAMNVRMLREVVLGQGAAKQTVVLIGAKIELPPELEPLATRFQMRLPDDAALAKLLRETVTNMRSQSAG